MSAHEGYKWFIDQFVTLAEGNVTAQRIKEHGHAERTDDVDFPLSANDRKRKELFRSMTSSQRELISSMLIEERTGAFHDALCFIEGEIASENLTVSAKGSAIAESPYGSFHYDFICRLEGDSWPD